MLSAGDGSSSGTIIMCSIGRYRRVVRASQLVVDDSRLSSAMSGAMARREVKSWAAAVRMLWSITCGATSKRDSEDS